MTGMELHVHRTAHSQRRLTRGHYQYCDASGFTKNCLQKYTDFCFTMAALPALALQVFCFYVIIENGR